MLDRAALGVNIFVHWKSTPKLSGSLSYFSYHSIHSIHVIYITGQFTPRAQIRMIYCTSVFFLQNRPKCSPCYTQIHIYTFTSAFAHVLDQFKFLPTFSHLHGVWETPEQSRKPCGRIRKSSISENTAE